MAANLPPLTEPTNSYATSATMRRLWDTGLKWIGCVIAMPLLVLAIVDPTANYSGIGYLVIALFYAGVGVLAWSIFWFIGWIVDGVNKTT